MNILNKLNDFKTCSTCQYYNGDTPCGEPGQCLKSHQRLKTWGTSYCGEYEISNSLISNIIETLQNKNELDYKVRRIATNLYLKHPEQFKNLKDAELNMDGSVICPKCNRDVDLIVSKCVNCMFDIINADVDIE